MKVLNLYTLFLTLTLFGVCPAMAVSVDLKPIEDLLEAGKTEEALTLIESLLDHFPSSSDLLYLKGNTANHETEALALAIEHNHWNRFREEDARFLLTERYLQQRRPTEALDVLQGLAEERRKLPAYLYYLVLGQNAVGNRESAFTTLRQAMSMFPKDPQFLVLYFRLKQIAAPDDSRLLDIADAQSPYYVKALGEYILALPEGDLAERLREEYLRLGGKDPRVLATLPLTLENFEAQWEQCIALGALDRMEFWEALFIKHPEGDLHQKIATEWNNYSGWMEKDGEQDGFFEERRRFADGSITNLVVDLDQNGIWDLMIDFIAQKPKRLQLDTLTDGTTTVFFNDYPRVDRIVEEKKDFTLEHWYGNPPLVWKDLPFPLEEGTLPLGLSPVNFSPAQLIVLLDLSTVHPYLRIQTLRSSTRTRKFYYLDGALVSLQEEEEIRANEFRRRMVTFQNGAPVRGFVDVDGDGSYDLRETYHRGKLDFIELLAGGRPVYREFLSNELKEWDFNGDGKVDAREFRLREGKRRTEFSTLLDGIFDERDWMVPE